MAGRLMHEKAASTCGKTAFRFEDENPPDSDQGSGTSEIVLRMREAIA